MMLFTGGNDDEETKKKKHMQIMNSMHSATKSLKDIYDRYIFLHFSFILTITMNLKQHPIHTQHFQTNAARLWSFGRLFYTWKWINAFISSFFFELFDVLLILLISIKLKFNKIKYKLQHIFPLCNILVGMTNTRQILWSFKHSARPQFMNLFRII